MPSTLLESDEIREALSERDWLPPGVGVTVSQREMLSARGRAGWYPVSASRTPRPVVFRITGGLQWSTRASWMDETIRAAIGLTELPPNWDSYGALQIQLECVEYALGLLLELVHENTPSPAVVPTSAGGIQFEWHRKGIDLEIEIEALGRVHYFTRDMRAGTEKSGILPGDLRNLRSAIGRLAD